MTAGQLFLESLSSGVITQTEIDWLLSQQGRFSRAEQAAMQRLGRLLDQGQIQLGCRVPPRFPCRQLLQPVVSGLLTQSVNTRALASGCSNRNMRSSATRRQVSRNRGMAMPNSWSKSASIPAVSASPQARIAQQRP